MTSPSSPATISVEQGTRYQWASSTTDERALQNPEKTVRIPAALYDPSQIKLKLTFAAAYIGKIELYAVDWDSTERRETISVNGETAALASEFNGGAWVSVPVTVEAGASVSITVSRVAGPNAVLSGVFLQ